MNIKRLFSILQSIHNVEYIAVYDETPEHNSILKNRFFKIQKDK